MRPRAAQRKAQGADPGASTGATGRRDEQASRLSPDPQERRPTMSVTTEKPEGATAIRPFIIETPKADLDDLRARIAATRWPSKELVADRSQGVQLATIQELARYWAEDYDFGRIETRLNALPQFTTEIDGVDVHFIHVRS